MFWKCNMKGLHSYNDTKAEIGTMFWKVKVKIPKPYKKMTEIKIMSWKGNVKIPWFIQWENWDRTQCLERAVRTFSDSYNDVKTETESMSRKDSVTIFWLVNIFWLIYNELTTEAKSMSWIDNVKIPYLWH